MWGLFAAAMGQRLRLGALGAGGELREYELAPEDVGVERSADHSVEGGTPEHNAAVSRGILDGEGDGGAARGLTVLNAAAAIYVAGRAGSIAGAAPLALAAIDSGAAREVMERFVARSRELA